MSIVIRSRKSRSHFHGVSQSRRMTQVVCSRSEAVKVSRSNGVNWLDGLGNSEKVSRARISSNKRERSTKGGRTVVFLVDNVNVGISEGQGALQSRQATSFSLMFYLCLFFPCAELICSDSKSVDEFAGAFCPPP